MMTTAQTIRSGLCLMCRDKVTRGKLNTFPWTWICPLIQRGAKQAGARRKLLLLHVVAIFSSEAFMQSVMHNN
jgi:hypothetical protein